MEAQGQSLSNVTEKVYKRITISLNLHAREVSLKIAYIF
jgi:hypothetical protein